MAIVVRYKPVGLTREKYDASTQQLEQAGVPWPPDGLDHHICFGEDGSLNVSEIWDSREQWEAFVAQLVPALSDAGIEFSGDPDVFEVHDSFRR
jgi:hypothetical protein